MTPNPHEVLRISARATRAEAIARAGQLVGETAEEDLRHGYRLAIEALATHPQDRAYHQFWEPPDTEYEEEAEAQFCRQSRTGPVERKSLNRRVKAFVENDCASHRLLESVDASLAPPNDLEALNPGGAPLAPLCLPLEPWELTE
jgi:hypothetical protein